MKSLAMGLIILGLALIAIGVLLLLAWRWHLPLGRLPGDFRWSGKGWSVYFPLATSILLSLILTVLLNFFWRR